MKQPGAAPLVFEADTQARLERFAALLRRWNRTINLIARDSEADLWRRHVLDSAQLAALLPTPPATLIDVGSGAGFPGLVLALTTGWAVHLVESDQRKAAFLREAVRETGATAQVHAARIEALRLPPAGVVTARALAALPDLLAMAVPLLAPGGICLFPKGQAVDDELTAAAAGWHMRVERFASLTSAGACILRLGEIRRGAPAN